MAEEPQKKAPRKAGAQTEQKPVEFEGNVAAEQVAPAAPAEVEMTDAERARERQHPSLTGVEGGDAIEVAERTIDIDTATEGPEAATTQHVKDFVVPASEWPEDEEGRQVIHERNKRAVRQGLLNQGLRTTADVEFLGADEIPSPRKDRPLLGSVVLRYGVVATPAAVAEAFGEQHMIVTDGPFTDPEKAFEFEVGRDERLRQARLAKAGELAPVERTEAKNEQETEG